MITEQPRRAPRAQAGPQARVVEAQVRPPRAGQLRGAQRTAVGEGGVALRLAAGAAVDRAQRVVGVVVVHGQRGIDQAAVAALQPVQGPLLVLTAGQIGAEGPFAPQPGAKRARTVGIAPLRAPAGQGRVLDDGRVQRAAIGPVDVSAGAGQPRVGGQRLHRPRQPALAGKPGVRRQRDHDVVRGLLRAAVQRVAEGEGVQDDHLRAAFGGQSRAAVP